MKAIALPEKNLELISCGIKTTSQRGGLLI